MRISRQAYYKRNRACDAQARHAQEVMGFVREKRLRQPRLGTRKLHNLMRTEPEVSVKVGRDRLFDILRDRRELVPADITYLPTQTGVAYLSLITDAYSRKIVGHHVHESLHTESVIQAFSKALKQRTTEQCLVHHSDRGVQYCSELYQRLHAKYSITCSMTDGYDCYQNALAERVNGILKTEFLLHRPKDLAEATRMVDESVQIYNNERPHLSLKYKTPDAVHRAF